MPPVAKITLSVSISPAVVFTVKVSNPVIPKTSALRKRTPSALAVIFPCQKAPDRTKDVPIHNNFQFFLLFPALDPEFITRGLIFPLAV